jgi:hypothetical protein
MPIDTLTARANTGTGTDTLAGRATPSGFAGAVVGTNAAGDDWERLASEATLAALNAKVPAQSGGRVPVEALEPALSIAGAAAQTAIVNNILDVTSGVSWLDVSNYRSASVQVVSTGTGGTFIFEQSNDGVNAIALPIFNAGLTTGAAIIAAITATASAIIYTLPLRCRFVRLRIVTTITGGSIQAFSRMSTEAWTPTIGNVSATASINAGVNAIGDVGIQARANATGAASIRHVVSAATTNPTIVKATAGRVLGWSLGNPSAGWRYVKLHNSATIPTAGAGVVQTIAIPPGGLAQCDLAAGLGFSAGIGLTIVTGAADADATAVAANDVVGDIFFA